MTNKHFTSNQSFLRMVGASMGISLLVTSVMQFPSLNAQLRMIPPRTTVHTAAQRSSAAQPHVARKLPAKPVLRSGN